VAIEVPEIVLIAESEPIHAEVISVPGAKMSTQVPQLEKYDLISSCAFSTPPTSVEPTQTAEAALAGEKLQALRSLFPAATAKNKPVATAALTASVEA